MENKNFETIYEVVRIKQVVKEAEIKERIKTPADAYKIAQQFIGDEDREVFLVICLSTKNDIIAVHRAHIGAINSSIVHPREVFKSAILNNSASIIVAHNHPSGDVAPSPEDIQVTERLVNAGLILGIEVLDSLVVSENSYLSMKEKGYI